MSGLILGTVVSAIAGVIQQFGWSRQTRKYPDGTEVLRCYLRGWNDPYPAALYSGRLILPPGGPLRFESSMGRVREMIFPQGGLTVSTMRHPGNGDNFLAAGKRNFKESTIFACADQAGGTVDVLVLPNQAKQASTFLQHTRSAGGPTGAQTVREVGRIRQLIGPFTIISTLLMMIAVGLLVSAYDWVPGQLTEVRGSGSLTQCRYEWIDPKTAEPRVDVDFCSESSEVGPTTLKLDKSGWPTRELMYEVLVGLLGVAALYGILLRLIMLFRERPPTQTASSLRAYTPADATPIPKSGRRDFDLLVEAAQRRSRDESWHARRLPPPAPATELGQSWWRQPIPRRSALRWSLGQGTVALIFMVIGVLIPLSAADDQARLDAGPTVSSTATVFEDITGKRIPGSGYRYEVRFRLDGKLVSQAARVYAATELVEHETVPIEYLVADPTVARIGDDRDGIPTWRTAWLVVVIGSVLAWLGLIWWGLRTALRQSGATRGEGRPMAYALTTTTKGDFVAVLLAPDRLHAQKLELRPNAGTPAAGTAIVRRSQGRYPWASLQIGDEVFYPGGRLLVAHDEVAEIVSRLALAAK